MPRLHKLYGPIKGKNATYYILGMAHARILFRKSFYEKIKKICDMSDVIALEGPEKPADLRSFRKLYSKTLEIVKNSKRVKWLAFIDMTPFLEMTRRIGWYVLFVTLLIPRSTKFYWAIFSGARNNYDCQFF